ncbi:hypothetical protein L4D00_24745, partial [Photobacterium swingsii]
MRIFWFTVFIVLLVSGCSSKHEECTTLHSCAVGITNRIQNNLLIDKNFAGKRAVVELSLDSKSALENVEVVENDGGIEFENAIIKAVSATFLYEELLNLSESEYSKENKINSNTSVIVNRGY